MSIRYAILGLLSWQPMSGYDIKKKFGEFEALYWSDNNNVIYKALVELEHESLVSHTVLSRESGPSRKEYDITEGGRRELDIWLREEPRMGESRNAFLIQLLWSHGLTTDELLGNIQAYRERLDVHILMAREHTARGHQGPDRSNRERAVWDMVSRYRVDLLAAEISWLDELTGRIKMTGENPEGE